VRGTVVSESIRAVISIYERPQPYQHFLMCAYEPQSSREWEVLADSIDVFRLFTDDKESKDHVPQALDLTNPSTQDKLAEVLVNCVELAERNDELVLVVPQESIRNYVEQHKSIGLAIEAPLAESMEAAPATSRVTTRNLPDAFDPLASVEQRTGDRLFTAQRRFILPGSDVPEPYKIQIYDSPLISTLHSYVVVASPVRTNYLAAAGLPVAILAGATQAGGATSTEQTSQLGTFTLKIDDKVLANFLEDGRLLEPTMQEQLLHSIFQALYVYENEADRKLAIGLGKAPVESLLAQARGDPKILAELQEQGHLAPGMVPSTVNTREIGGQYPLNRLRVTAGAQGKALAGPSLRGGTNEENGKIFARDWKKVFCMAQRFGTQTIIITVSKRRYTYKLAVYEPETSALYEMLLETSASSTPLNVLIERCDLAGKLDLIMCMHEVSFPHKLSVNLMHLPTSQEFNLQIGDDFVYTMIENSRREAFMIYLDQLVHWGVIGFDAVPGTEEEVLANIYDETFAGNQIFDKTHIEDLLQEQMAATVESGAVHAPTAMAPQPPKKMRVPVVRTQLDFLGKQAKPVAGMAMSLLYHAEHKFEQVGMPTQTLLMRIHKKSSNNDIAITLRSRTADMEMSLPSLPGQHLALPSASSANGRPFETPALAPGEGPATSEVTLWYSDKCSRVPTGVYGELVEVPGIDKPLLLLITDDDSPRAIRVAVTLAILPFTVLFQVVFLEHSETSAKVDVGKTSRRVLQQAFLKYFASGRAPTSAVLSQMSKNAEKQRDMDLKQKLDAISATEGPAEHLGLEHGHGSGEPIGKRQEDQQSGRGVQTNLVHMCTRQKLGRMMVFTVFRDMIAQNMYLRIVMHDPTNSKEQHLTLLHYTTMRLFGILRINRDMIEDVYDNMTGDDKRDRSKLRAELGKLIVDHLYLSKVGDQLGEAIDDQEFPDGEEVEYQLRMRDIMSNANSAELSIKQKTLDSAHELFPETSRALTSIGTDTPAPPDGTHRAQRSQEVGPETKHPLVPKTVIEMTDDHLLHKAEKVVNGRRVLIAFYNETNVHDNVNYSHNIRIVVACVQSLAVLVVRDFHEDTLEVLCARRGKRHLMSATSELELVRELCDVLALEHVGQKITGITFAGLEDT